MAQRGLNVALIDLDFRAPSLYHIFREMVREPINFWVNDYLNSLCKPEDFLREVRDSLNLNGSLLVGLANPSVYAIEDMLGKSRSWEANSLKKLMELRKFLFNVLDVDLCIYDSSPGIQYSSLNAIVCSDKVVYVATSDPLDIEGVRESLKEFSDIFGDKVMILLNKVFPETDYWPEDRQRKFCHQVSKKLESPILGVIPCYCDILKAERRRILAFEKLDHPFLKELVKISQKLLEGGNS